MCGNYRISSADLVAGVKKDAVYTDSGVAGLGYWRSEIDLQAKYKSKDLVIISFAAWHESEDRDPASVLLSLNNVFWKKAGQTTELACKPAPAQGI